MSTYVKGERITGMTLARAKAIARANNGHLPLCGYETCVFESLYDAEYPFGKQTYRIWLVNTSGSLTLRESW